MRASAIAGRVLMALWLVMVPALAQRAADPAGLAAFARQIGLHEIDGFVATVASLRQTDRLPPQYVTKTAARAHGWHGGGLCATWPGHAIGGDAFHNFGAVLPAAPGRRYREADLDETCDSRGPKRLIFSNDGRLYVTIDHYNSFVPVP